MLAKTVKLDKDQLLALIRQAETRHDFRMNIEDFDFITEALTTFVNEALDKFVAGCKEHYDENSPCFVHGVDHMTETRKEIIDLWMYQLALKHQLRNRGKNSQTSKK